MTAILLQGIDGFAIGREQAENARQNRVRDCATANSNDFEHFLSALHRDDAAKLKAVRAYARDHDLAENDGLLVDARGHKLLLSFTGIHRETDGEALTRTIGDVRGNMVATCARTR